MCKVHSVPTSALAPQDAARCQVAKIPPDHLEHLEGKIRSGPPTCTKDMQSAKAAHRKEED